jgi:hypothetical protein
MVLRVYRPVLARNCKGASNGGPICGTTASDTALQHVKPVFKATRDGFDRSASSSTPDHNKARRKTILRRDV